MVMAENAEVGRWVAFSTAKNRIELLSVRDGGEPLWTFESGPSVVNLTVHHGYIVALTDVG